LASLAEPVDTGVVMLAPDLPADRYHFSEPY
jgi:hypothetical protein